MQIKPIINTVENLAKKAPYPERIASSVRMPGVKGTEAQRSQLACELNDKLFKIVEDAFWRKTKKKEVPQLSERELLNCVKKVLPKVALHVKYQKDPICAAFVEPVFNAPQKTIVGLILGMKSALKKKKNEFLLRHEMRHIFDYMTQPKILGRTNTSNLVGKLKNYNHIKDMKHFDFYIGNLYRSRQCTEDQKEISLVAEHIKDHFEVLKSSPEEKIEILQKWRYGLKTEVNAYNDEAGFACKENPKKYLKESIRDYFFEGKIRLIEQLLKDEIATVRTGHAEKLGQTP